MARAVNINDVPLEINDGEGDIALPRSMYGANAAPVAGAYESDAEMAARLQRELNPKPGNNLGGRLLHAGTSSEVAHLQNEIDRNAREQQRLALEISSLESGGGNDGYYLNSGNVSSSAGASGGKKKKGRRGKKKKKTKNGKKKQRARLYASQEFQAVVLHLHHGVLHRHVCHRDMEKWVEI